MKRTGSIYTKYMCGLAKYDNDIDTSLSINNESFQTSRLLRVVMLLLFFGSFFFANAKIPEHINFKSPIDTLFYKGISFHKSGKYNEAIPYFLTVITDSTYTYNRHQMQSYARMWLGSCYLKLNQSDSIKDQGIIYFSEPIDPRIMEDVDSLSLEGFNMYESDLEKCIQIFEHRQTLLEERIPSNHIWVNGGREILLKLYKERLFPIGRMSELSFLDEKESILLAKKIAQIADKYYLSCKYNYVISPIIEEISDYYDELMRLLWLTSSTSYLNHVSEISISILKEIYNITSIHPDVIENNIYHYYNMGFVHYSLGESLNSDPNPKLNSNGIDYVKKAISFYNQFNEILSQKGIKDEYKIKLNERLLDCYLFLCYNPEPNEDNAEPNLPQFNYYNIDETNDATDQKYQENVNRALTVEVMGSVVANSLSEDGCINDCYMDDLSTYEKEYVRLWIEQSQNLKELDVNEYLDFCLFDCYKKFHLLKDKLQFQNNLLNYTIENASNLKYKYYYQFYQLSECAKTCADLAHPLMSPIFSLCKHTCDEKEMEQFVLSFFSYTQKFKQLYTSIAEDLPNLEFIECNSIKILYEKLLIDEAGLLFNIAQKKATLIPI